MVIARVGQIIRFVLAVVEGIGIVLGRSEEPDTWRVKQVAKDGSLTETHVVPVSWMTETTPQERFFVSRYQGVFIQGLLQEEYRPSVLNHHSGGSKKKSSSNAARWARIEAEKAKGIFVSRKSNKHKKSDNQKGGKKKGKK